MKTFITRTVTALFFVAIMLGASCGMSCRFFSFFFCINFFVAAGVLQTRAPDRSGVQRGFALASLWRADRRLCGHDGGNGPAFRGKHFSLGEIGWVLAFIFILLLPLGEILMSRKLSLKTIG